MTRGAPRVRTRFAGWPPAPALGLLAAFALLVISGLAQGDPRPANTLSLAQSTNTDKRLYERIVAGVDAGHDYYTVAASAHRVGGYPLKPFVTMRLPTLATMLAWLGPAAARALLAALALAALIAWLIRLRPAFAEPPQALIPAALMAIGGAVTLYPGLIVFHEIWAALLIALSLALWRPGRWWPAVLIGLAAAVIRETALPYLLAMAGVALLERRWRESLSWSAAIGLVAVILVVHANAVASVVRADDAVSPGWSSFGGWPGFVAMMRLTTPLTLLPYAASAVLIPLSLLGWAAWRSSLALRTLLLLGGYSLMFALFARPDNLYWGLLIAPLLLGGLGFAPAGLRDLLAAARAPAGNLDRAAIAGQ